MSFKVAKLVDGRTSFEFDDEPIGSGAEKKAFITRDRRHVVLFYHGGFSDNRNSRRRRLDRLLTDRNPTIGNDKADYWKAHFCWPIGILDGDCGLPQSFFSDHNLITPAFGIVAPAYSENFFFTDVRGSRREKNAKWFTGPATRKMVPPDELGDFLGYLQVCTRTARAVRKLHLMGLAHSDLSNKNVLIDPRRGGACVIDVDTLVVPGLAPPSVFGTPGYIAPEVIAGRIMADGRTAQPCIATDRYALGVLIYENLLQRHPIARQRPVRPELSAEEDQALAMGEKALFTEHPTNRDNWHTPRPEIRLEHLGSFLNRMFLKLFVDGLHDPELRPPSPDWERALYRTLNLIHPSPIRQGEKPNWFILEPPAESGGRVAMRCPFTKRYLTEPVPYARFSRQRKGELLDEKRSMTIYHGFRLKKWHVLSDYSPDESADQTTLGGFMFREGKWFLVNESGVPMKTVDGREVPDKALIELKPGFQIWGSMEANSRVLTFDFMLP